MEGIKYRFADEMKDSGIEWIGQIPREWSFSKVGFFYDIQLGKMLQPQKSTSCDSLENYLCSVNVDWMEIDTDNTKEMWFSAAEKKKYDVQVGDLIVNEGGDAGKAGFVKRLQKNVYFQNAVHRVRSQKKNDLHVLYYWLFFLKSVGYIDLICNKSTIMHFTGDKFYNLISPVICVSEQSKISNFLDIKTAQFDSIIAKKEQLIAKLEEAKKSLISEVVTGKVKIVDGQLVPRLPEEMKDSGVEWLGMIPKEWRACSIKHALEKSSNSIRVGPFGSQLKGEDFNGDFAKIYTQKNVIKCDLILGDDFVTKSKYSEMLAFKVSAGDILLTTRGTIGKIARVSHEAVTGIIHPTLIKFRINDSVLDYDLLQMLFNETDFIEKQVQYMSNSTTIPVIYSDTLKNLRIPLIPVEEQHRIVDFLKLKLRFIDVSIKEENVQLDLLKSAKQSLISEAVTGKIDLRDWEIIEQGGAS